MSMGLRPYRSPSRPQIGLAIAIERPDALAAAAVHRSRSWPGWTPRSFEMELERNGKAKLKPKIAMNSANHSAARLRRQLTPPLLIGGVVALGSVLRAGGRASRRCGPPGWAGDRPPSLASAGAAHPRLRWRWWPAPGSSRSRRRL